MGKVTYRSLYESVANLVDKRQQFSKNTTFDKQLSRDLIAPQSFAGAGQLAEIRIADLINALQDLISDSIPSRVISGLLVSETDPISDSVTVTAGTGSAGGRVYTLAEDVTLPIPFDLSTTIFYVTIHLNRIAVDYSIDDSKLVIAKIIVPEPGTTARVVNKRPTDGSPDAYIVNYRPVTLYQDGNNNLEDESLDFFRDQIGPILADNLIGNIRLSENLKVINTAGSVELDSKELRIKDTNQNVLSKFTRNGVFFYNTNKEELSRFTGTDARIGNIKITGHALQSENFISGSTGFQIKDTGDVEFNNLIVRGIIYATGGEIADFTISNDKLYGGTIQTSLSVGAGASGVVMNSDGLFGYDSVLGLVFSLPTDGSAPTFSSGIIRNVIFEINTNSVLRTSETVGDGSSASYGILINNTGLYGVGANQTLGEANLKALITGEVALKGQINATGGTIGGIAITSTGLSGGVIEGAILRGSLIETSTNLPRVRIDSTGIYYQTTTNIGKYGASGSGLYGFKYGDGTVYGTGVTAYLFKSSLPVLAVMAERDLADIRLFNRSAVPGGGTGPHALGDLIAVDGAIMRCWAAGSPGNFDYLTSSDGTTGAASVITGYVELVIGNTVFKVLHNGTA